MSEEQKKSGAPAAEAAVTAADKAPDAEGATTEAGKAAPKKKSKKKRILEAVVNINATYNNTIVTITEPNGNVLCWASSGACGFKGTRKATPYASSVAADTALTKAKLLGVEKVHIRVKGVGTGRDQALRAINASGVAIESITDKTAIPHNGCRPRKARRV